MRPAKPTITKPTFVVNNSMMYSLFTANMYSPMPNGMMPRTQADSRPSDVSTRICRRMVARSRSVSDTLSRISARFPPTSRWMFTARTAHLKSALPTRSERASRASSAPRPRRISATTRWNSVAAGCAISFAVVSSAWRKL
jgi:hypothetical protein